MYSFYVGSGLTRGELNKKYLKIKTSLYGIKVLEINQM